MGLPALPRTGLSPGGEEAGARDPASPREKPSGGSIAAATALGRAGPTGPRCPGGAELQGHTAVPPFSPCGQE